MYIYIYKYICICIYVDKCTHSHILTYICIHVDKYSVIRLRPLLTLKVKQLIMIILSV